MSGVRLLCAVCFDVRFDFVFVFACRWIGVDLAVCCFVLGVFGFALCELFAPSWLWFV